MESGREGGTSRHADSTAPLPARQRGAHFCADGLLRLEVGDEEVDVLRVRFRALGRPDQLAAVRAEHGKSVESLVRRDLLEAAAVEMHEVEIEVAATRVLVVRREDELLAVVRP